MFISAVDIATFAAVMLDAAFADALPIVIDICFSPDTMPLFFAMKDAYYARS